MSESPQERDSLSNAADAESKEALPEESQKMPLSVRVAIACWLVFVALALWTTARNAVAGNGKGFFVFLLASGLASILLVGLLRRTTFGWWWNRFIARLLGIFSAIPLVFGAACIVFRLLGGAIPGEMGFLVRVMLIAGVILLVPSLVLWTIYWSLNTVKARQYCHVCPDCSKRFKMPIQFLFSKMACDLCRDGARARQ